MGAETRARLALLGLVGITLFSFVDVFAEPSFVGPGIVAVAFATGISLGARRLRLPTWATLAASALGLLFYLGLVFEPSATLFGLPTPAVGRDLYLAMSDAFRRSAVDFAPVPARQGYVVMISCGVWAATALGEVATFRLRRPLMAAAPSIALFAVVLIVGAGKATAFWVAVFLAVLLTYLAAEARHSARFWGRWVTAWSDRAPS